MNAKADFFALLVPLESLLRRVSRGLALVGALVLLAMLAVTCANIALRPLSESIRGTVEISGYLCALGVGLAMPAAQWEGAHISAGLWEKRLPPKVRLLQQMIVNLLCAGALVLTARELFSIAGYAYDMDEYIEGFPFTYAPMAIGFSVALLLQCAFFLVQLIRLFSPSTGDRS